METLSLTRAGTAPLPESCVFLGNTCEANEVYSAYQAQMTTLFKSWGLTGHPSQDAQKEWESVRAFMDSHYFSAQAV